MSKIRKDQHYLAALIDMEANLCKRYGRDPMTSPRFRRLHKDLQVMVEEANTITRVLRRVCVGLVLILGAALCYMVCSIITNLVNIYLP